MEKSMWMYDHYDTVQRKEYWFVILAKDAEEAKKRIDESKKINTNLEEWECIDDGSFIVATETGEYSDKEVDVWVDNGEPSSSDEN